MSARQQPIYEVRIDHLLETIPGLGRVPELTYFTNLKKTIDTLRIVLEANGWPVTINYSAVYRHLQLKNSYSSVFVLEHVRYFRLTITKRIINPHLTSLGIEEMPRPRRGISGSMLTD